MPPKGELLTICAWTVARRFQRREINIPAEDMAGSITPTLHESGLKLLDNRSFDPNVGIAPLAVGAPIPGPFFGNAVTAGETKRAVDHQNPPVIAIIVIQQLPWV